MKIKQILFFGKWRDLKLHLKTLKTLYDYFLKKGFNSFSSSSSLLRTVENFVLLKCRKLRREDQETSDWIVSRISLFYDMCCYLQSSKISS